MSVATPVECLDRIVSQHGSSRAVSATGQTLTFSELGEESERLARAILASGHDLDVPVAILVCDLPDLVVAMFGVWKAGGFFTLIDPGYPSERVKTILEHSLADLVITDGTIETIPGANAGPEVLLLADLKSFGSERIARPEVTDSTIAMITYTSGSTGRPKGIIRLARPMMKSLEEESRGRFGRGPGDRVAILSSLSFAGGVGRIIRSLLNGASVHHFDVRRSSLLALADWLDLEQISIMHIPPSLFRHLSIAVDESRVFSSVSQVYLGGDFVTIRDVGHFRSHFREESALRVILASSEARTYARYDITRETRIDGPLVPVGRPLDDVDLWIEGDNGRAVPAGEAGEIVVSSAQVTAGYWNEPEAAQLRFVEDPSRPGRRIFHTGDIGRIDQNGLLYFLGRKDDQLKVRGHRVEPIEVESAILKNHAVDEVTVIGRKRATGETGLIAWIGTRDVGFNLDVLRNDLAGHLPGYMVPERIEVLDSLPRTPNGKVDRRALANRESPAKPASHPTDPIESWLLSIWTVVLERDGIDVNDRFFQIGGNSILAVRIVAEIEKEFGEFDDPGKLIAAPTIVEQAVVVRDAVTRRPPRREERRSWLGRLFGGVSKQ